MSEPLAQARTVEERQAFVQDGRVRLCSSDPRMQRMMATSRGAEQLAYPNYPDPELSRVEHELKQKLAASTCVGVATVSVWYARARAFAVLYLIATLGSRWLRWLRWLQTSFEAALRVRVEYMLTIWAAIPMTSCIYKNINKSIKINKRDASAK